MTTENQSFVGAAFEQHASKTKGRIEIHISFKAVPIAGAELENTRTKAGECFVSDMEIHGKDPSEILRNSHYSAYYSWPHLLTGQLT